MAIGSEIGAFNLGFLTSGPRLFLPLSIGAVLLKQIFFFFFLDQSLALVKLPSLQNK